MHARSQTKVRVSDSSRAALSTSRRRLLGVIQLCGPSSLSIFGTMKVLVVGATGYLGSRIAVESARRGHKVTALVSEDSQSKKADIVQSLRDAGIEIVTGQLESKQELLVELLTDVNIVSVYCSNSFIRKCFFTIGIGLIIVDAVGQAESRMGCFLGRFRLRPR